MLLRGIKEGLNKWENSWVRTSNIAHMSLPPLPDPVVSPLPPKALTGLFAKIYKKIMYFTWKDKEPRRAKIILQKRKLEGLHRRLILRRIMKP